MKSVENTGKKISVYVSIEVWFAVAPNFIDKNFSAALHGDNAILNFRDVG
jgi:uncharacterized membrane protein YqgA involved in biofilm formation